MKGRYLKTLKRTTAPGRILSLSVASKCPHSGRGRHNLPRDFVYAIATYQQRRGDVWGRPIHHKLESRADVWALIYSLSRDSSPIVVFTPLGGMDWTIAGIWEEIEHERIVLWKKPEANTLGGENPLKAPNDTKGRLIMSNPPDICYGYNHGGPFRMYGLRNYTKATMEELAAAANFRPSRLANGRPSCGIRYWSAEDACELTHRTATRFIDWWRAGDYGPWRDTSAQLATAIFQRKFYGGKLLMHDHDEVSHLERRACHGGRVSCWYYGDIGRRPRPSKDRQPPPPPYGPRPLPGPAYRFDVRSQYPALLARHAFPTVCQGYAHQIDVEGLAGRLRYQGAIAAVRLTTDHAEYPYRTPDRTHFPVGTFDTTLAGPELEQALAAGVVDRVYSAAFYTLSNQFRSFMEWSWEERVRARASGDPVAELWAKTLANAFAGKLAQRPMRWVPCPSVWPHVRWGPSVTIDASSGEVFVCRNFGDHVERRADGGKRPPIAAAVFAYLTSFARLQMLRIREAVPKAQTYCMDTDCVWVGEEGKNALGKHGFIMPNHFGGLKMDPKIEYLRFITPRRYYADGTWTLSGIADGFTVTPQLNFVEFRHINPYKHVRNEAYDTVYTQRRVTPLRAITPPGILEPSGWLKPYRIHPSGQITRTGTG